MWVKLPNKSRNFERASQSYLVSHNSGIFGGIWPVE